MEEVRSFQVHRPRSVYSAGSDSSSLGSISYRSYRRICIRIHDGPLIESLPQHLSLDHLGHGAKQDIRVYCCCCCCCCCEVGGSSGGAESSRRPLSKGTLDPGWDSLLV